MTQRLGTQAIVVNTTQIFNAPSMGLKGLIIDNASPFALQVGLEGSSVNKTLQPASTDFFPVVQGFNGNVVYKSQALVSNPQSYTNYLLTVDAVGITEKVDVSQYPVARPQAAVNPTASGQPIFSVTAGFGSTAGVIQSLNVFNPQNSGVSYQFHSARFFSTNAANGDFASLVLVTGADLNLPIGETAVSHDAGINPPTTSAHCTAQDDGTGHGGTTIEILDFPAGQTQDFLAFPDQVILRPGNNLRVAVVTTGAVGKVCRLTLKWTEVPQIAANANTGGATTGNILIASTLVNNGSPAGTGVISIAQAAGGSPTNVYVDNQGNMLFSKGGMHLGQAANGDTLETDNNGNLIIRSASSVSPTIKFQPNLTNTDIAVLSSTGFQVKNGGAFDFETAGTVLNGGTSGTATLFQDQIGLIKRVMIVLNNFRTAGVAQNIVLPVAFTVGAHVKTGGTGSSATNAGISVLAGGVQQSWNVITAIAAGGGTGTGNANIFSFSFGEIIHAFDTVQFQANGTAGHSAIVFIEGQ